MGDLGDKMNNMDYARKVLIESKRKFCAAKHSKEEVIKGINRLIQQYLLSSSGEKVGDLVSEYFTPGYDSVNTISVHESYK